MMSSADIHLRAVEPEDLELLYRIENDPSFWRYGSTTVPYSRYALRQYLTQTQNDLFADRQIRFVIEHSDGQALGLADLCNFDPQHLRAEISLAVLPEHQGQQVGQMAVERLWDFAVNQHLRQLYAIIAISNKPATRLFERLGFRPASVLKDWIRDGECFVDACLWQRLNVRDDCHR